MFFVLIALIIVVFVGIVVARSKHKQTQTRPPRKKVPPSAPITTVKEACDTLRQMLADRGYGRRYKELLSGAVADLRVEMREHSEALRDNIGFLKEEIEKQREYREAVLDDIKDRESFNNNTLEESEYIAKRRRHVGYLDAEIAQMERNFERDKTLLEDFRADRRSFVEAYAAYTMNSKLKNPNVARSRTG